MSTQDISRPEQLNRLSAFRQAVYAEGLTQARATQFELMDALLLSGPPSSFVALSLSPTFRRRWSSAYAALADGRQAAGWFEAQYLALTPRHRALVVALDGTAWPHPAAQTLADLQYVHSPAGALGGRPVVVGHAYSILAWVPGPGRSWALPLSIAHMASDQSATQVAVVQLQQLLAHRAMQRPGQVLVVVTDAKYGNQHFLRPFAQQPDLVRVTRLRRDHVLFGPPGAYSGRGRHRKHGARFAFKEPWTWGPPSEDVLFTDAQWGEVRLRRWLALHLEGAADVVFAVVLAEVHQECVVPPAPLWLAYLGPAEYAVRLIWHWYQYRWPIEPAIRFRKQGLAWTTPHCESLAACDRWTQLVSCAYWQLYLARNLVQDAALPWQKAQVHLTPGRVQQALGALYSRLGTPVAAPQTRGKSPGWPVGRPRTPRARYPVVKKAAAKPARVRAPT